MISASAKPVNVGRKVFCFQQEANNDENIEIYKSKSKFKTVPLLRTKTYECWDEGGIVSPQLFRWKRCDPRKVTGHVAVKRPSI